MKTPSYVAFCLLGISLPATSYADQTFITNFNKNNNIYTNLNEQFPHTGTGVPGSTVGTPLANFVFDPSPSAVLAGAYAPSYVSGSNLVNNGVNFKLTSDANGHDFDEFSAGASLSISSGVVAPSSIYLIMGAYNTVYVDLTLTGADGHQQKFFNLSLPDFNGGSINTVSSTYSEQTLFRTLDVGAGGTGNSTTGQYNYYDITELGFQLDSILANEKLNTITLSAHDGNKALLYGVTAITSLPGDANQDGVVNADDYALIDRGKAKGLSGWSNGDFNGDGLVNASDYQIIDQTYATEHGLAPAVNVPEPGITMLTLGVMLTVSRRRK